MIVKILSTKQNKLCISIIIVSGQRGTVPTGKIYFWQASCVRFWYIIGLIGADAGPLYLPMTSFGVVCGETGRGRDLD